MTPQTFATDMQAQGFDAPVDVQRPQGWHLESHAHPFHARALILSGAIVLEVDGIQRTYRPGDIFDLPPDTPHLETVPDEGGVHYLSARRASGAGA